MTVHKADLEVIVPEVIASGYTANMISRTKEIYEINRNISLTEFVNYCVRHTLIYLIYLFYFPYEVTDYKKQCRKLHKFSCKAE